MTDQTDAQIAAAALSAESLDKALSYPQSSENQAALEAERNRR